MFFQELRAGFCRAAERNGFAVLNIAVVLLLIADVEPKGFVLENLNKALGSVNPESKCVSRGQDRARVAIAGIENDVLLWLPDFGRVDNDAGSSVCVLPEDFFNRWQCEVVPIFRTTG